MHAVPVNHLAGSELADVGAMRPAAAEPVHEHRIAVGPASGTDSKVIQTSPS